MFARLPGILGARTIRDSLEPVMAVASASNGEDDVVTNNLKPSQESTNASTPFLDKMGTELVDIFVGPEKKLFRVHKTFLCRKIDYFDKMFNGEFVEADGVASLPEDDPAAFDLLVEWIYNSNPRRIRGLVFDTDSEGISRPSWDAIGFYALAQRLCLHELQDLIMSVMIKYHKKTDELPSPEFARRAFKQTGVDSPLSKYAACSIYHVLQADSPTKKQAGWPTPRVQCLLLDYPEFTFNYIDLTRFKQPEDPRDFDKCYFHIHKTEEKCPPNGKKRKSLGSSAVDEHGKKRAKVEDSAADNS